MQREPSIPYGYCRCGCGEKTNISPPGRRGAGTGGPSKYLRGHHHRQVPAPPKDPYANGQGLCHCGCDERAPLAKATSTERGHWKGWPVRYVNGHQGRSSPVEYIEEDRGYDTPCWIWQRALKTGGYGAVGGGTTSLAHRMVYERSGRTIPAGLHLDHLCEQPACVNPDHLEPVTQSENNRRSRVAKLNMDKARAIRASNDNNSILARKYGVSRSAIYFVRQGWTWREAT